MGPTEGPGGRLRQNWRATTYGRPSLPGQKLPCDSIDFRALAKPPEWGIKFVRHGATMVERSVGIRGERAEGQGRGLSGPL